MTVKAGVATVNITPSVGFDNMGDYLRLTPAKGIGNELFAKALVLDDGQNHIAIETADIIIFTGWLLDDVRGRIESLTGGREPRRACVGGQTRTRQPTTTFW